MSYRAVSASEECWNQGGGERERESKELYRECWSPIYRGVNGGGQLLVHDDDDGKSHVCMSCNHTIP